MGKLRIGLYYSEGGNRKGEVDYNREGVIGGVRFRRR